MILAVHCIDRILENPHLSFGIQSQLHDEINRNTGFSQENTG